VLERAGAMTRADHVRPALLLLAAGVAVLIAISPAAHADDDSSYNGAPTVVSGGGVPTMNGVPCVGGHLGTCTGFAQNSPTPKMPRSVVGHSPTVSP
jgi:hypothetical protein